MSTCHSVWSTVRHPLLINVILACLSPVAIIVAEAAAPAAAGFVRPSPAHDFLRSVACAACFVL